MREPLTRTVVAAAWLARHVDFLWAIRVKKKLRNRKNPPAVTAIHVLSNQTLPVDRRLIEQAGSSSGGAGTAPVTI
jgi:hypothetical protein